MLPRDIDATNRLVWTKRARRCVIIQQVSFPLQPKSTDANCPSARHSVGSAFSWGLSSENKPRWIERAVSTNSRSRENGLVCDRTIERKTTYLVRKWPPRLHQPCQAMTTQQLTSRPFADGPGRCLGWLLHREERRPRRVVERTSGNAVIKRCVAGVMKRSARRTTCSAKAKCMPGVIPPPVL